MRMKSLDELYDALKSGEVELSPDLPTFGGPDIIDTDYIWSWDETRVLAGLCVNDLEIRGRED